MKTTLRSIDEARAYLAAKGTPRTDITDAQMPGYLAARGDVTWDPPAPTEYDVPTLEIRHPDQALDWLHARGDHRADDMPDAQRPWYIYNTYGLAPRWVETPSERTDTAAPATVQHQVMRTDTAAPPPAKYDPYAVFKRAHADSYAPAAVQADPAAPEDERNPNTGEPLTSYEKYRRDYDRARAAQHSANTATPGPARRDAAAPPAPPAAPAATGGRYDQPATSARAAAFARLAAVHADRSRDADPGAAGSTSAPQRPNVSARDRAWFDAVDAAFKASREEGNQ